MAGMTEERDGVDAHVARVSRRLGLTKHGKVEKIEQDLMKTVPKDEWVQFGPAMVLLGRYTCTAARPKCGEWQRVSRNVDSRKAMCSPSSARIVRNTQLLFLR